MAIADYRERFSRYVDRTDEDGIALSAGFKREIEDMENAISELSKALHLK
ncbi:hypothetical protein HA050_04125 [Iodobacter sp. HSC-16F04]|uniref:Uncharacterized protein n=1 Tax=Iodobacter violaceini TaxID=3044271 RepID=A0ABX0KM31_9NEIS|nr:hypothetical protein [Iodobacter violacea]NHQ85298.1 hypothetical protein [Iodobacter violacea]